MGDLPNLANLDYVHRVNRAIDHVTRNLAHGNEHFELRIQLAVVDA